MDKTIREPCWMGKSQSVDDDDESKPAFQMNFL